MKKDKPNNGKTFHRPRGFYQNPNAQWRREFLEIIADCGNVSEACRRLNLCWTEIYKVKLEDAAFRDQWEQAVEASLDKLEAEASRRAYACSDKLASWILSRRRPDKWGDKSKDKGGVTINPVINISERKEEPKGARDG